MKLRQNILTSLISLAMFTLLAAMVCLGGCSLLPGNGDSGEYGADASQNSDSSAAASGSGGESSDIDAGDLGIAIDYSRVWEMGGAEDLPLNAIDYHETWNEMVDRGWVTRTLLGYPSHGDENYPVYKYTLSANTDYVNEHYRVAEGELYERPRILITSGFHGAEKGAPTFLRNLVYDMMTDPEFARIAVQYDWDFVPLVNPWGYSHSLLRGGVLQVAYIHDGTSFAGYTVVENGEYNQGIRLNADSEDCNRNWYDGPGGFPSEEARLVRDVLLENDYDLVLDMHQTKNNIACAFVSIGLKPDDISDEEYEDKRTRVYTAVNQAGIVTDRAVAAFYGIDTLKQSSFPWDGTGESTFRNYAAGYTAGGSRQIDIDHHPKYSLCMETSPYCTLYSGQTPGVGYLKEANVYDNTFVHNFVRCFGELLRE